jgi:hypothetical protein
MIIPFFCRWNNWGSLQSLRDPVRVVFPHVSKQSPPSLTKLPRDDSYLSYDAIILLSTGRVVRSSARSCLANSWCVEATNPTLIGAAVIARPGAGGFPVPVEAISAIIDKIATQKRCKGSCLICDTQTKPTYLP